MTPSPIWIGGYANWTSACDTALARLGQQGRWMDPGDEPESGIGLLCGSAGDWYPFLDRVVRRPGSVLLGNPGAWSLHDLQRLERVADESGALIVTFRPWREAFAKAETAKRQVRLCIHLPHPARWKPAFGHAVDLLLQEVGTEHLSRADAIRTSDMNGSQAQLLAQLRFQNGAVAQLSIERGAAGKLTLAAPGHQGTVAWPDEESALPSAIARFLVHPNSLPTLHETIAGRKIEEKIMSILRQA